MSIKAQTKLRSSISNQNEQNQSFGQHQQQRTVKKILLKNQFEQKQTNNKPQNINKLCQRCLIIEANKICSNCNSLVLCQTCDQIIHEYGKFIYHCRTLLRTNGHNQNNKNCQCQNSISISTNNQQKLPQSNIEILNIHQIWNRIISDISNKFQQLKDQIEDKKKTIIQIVEHQKQKEIQNYLIFINQLKMLALSKLPQNENLKKQQNYLKNQIATTELKINKLSNQSLQQHITKKCKLFLTSLTDIQNQIKKINIKNILTFYYTEIPKKICHKPVRSSFQLCTSYPTHKIQHTKSISVSQYIPNSNLQKKTSNGKKTTVNSLKNQRQINILCRVKSDKIMYNNKSPTNNGKDNLFFAKQCMSTKINKLYKKVCLTQN